MIAIARVISDYDAIYPDPISGQAGDQLAIDESRETDIPGWVWCIHPSGKCGWTPVAWLDRQGNSARLLRDYDAIELTIRVGDRLVCHHELSGFMWVTDATGKGGWVPSSHVEIIPAKDE